MLNPDNAAFITANAPDAVFERVAGGNTASPTVVALTDGEIASNLTKSGSVLSLEELAEEFIGDFGSLAIAAVDGVPVPEPSSVLLTLGALALIGFGRRAGRG